jgi:drug/metabolite transporter (DMT)-like permease
MTLGLTTVLVCYAFGMAVGQVLFKFAAERAKHHSSGAFVGALFHDIYFLLAVVTYFGLTLVWVWVLAHAPLSRAYPFVVLAFVFTPALAWLFFGDALDRWYLLGLALILSGLAVLLWKSA